MSRRHKAEKREGNPGTKFGDLVVSKFMNSIMKEGKKSVAENIVYGAFERMQSRAKSDPIQLFHSALENVMAAREGRSPHVAAHSRPARATRAPGGGPCRARSSTPRTTGPRR